MREAMATITSVVQDDHKEEMAENGLLAMDLAEFEVSGFVKYSSTSKKKTLCTMPQW